ncbi:hypothetical protein ACLB2K_070994 [Fragaria x ananassa]
MIRGSTRYIICTLQVHARRNNGLYPLQSRAEGSQQFSTELDSWVLRRVKEFHRSLVNKITVLDNITAELLLLVFELCQKKTLMKLREIYYRNNELYQSPDKVGEVADDLCCLIGCTRSSLGITANEKGLFYGDVSFSVAKEDESTKHYDGLSNDNGTIIPAAKFKDITGIKSKALFILVVERGTVFERLLQDGFCDTYKCIIITAKGMPDVMTRGFLSLFARMLKLRVFALMDCNPDGLKIYGIYRYGSRAKSYDRENLTTPGIELLGISRHANQESKTMYKSYLMMISKYTAAGRFPSDPPKAELTDEEIVLGITTGSSTQRILVGIKTGQITRKMIRDIFVKDVAEDMGWTLPKNSDDDHPSEKQLSGSKSISASGIGDDKETEV